MIGNAIKYTPDNGSVDISLTQTDSQVSLSVNDSGIGMNKEDFEKIWERFYFVDSAKKQAKGSGLGLSIAKELVELHEGSITVDSAEGKGTTFTITLPIDS